ncbi:hypothetical protein GQ42DRAFT_109701, partial [Ramicandelaber brevisporus]
MGKRKSSKPVAKAKVDRKLDTVFDCAVCNHEKAVYIKVIKLEGKAELTCRVCKIGWECPAHDLSEGVDIYGDWIDFLE